LLGGWLIVVTATQRALGSLGLLVLAAFLVALVWWLFDVGWLSDVAMVRACASAPLDDGGRNGSLGVHRIARDDFPGHRHSFQGLRGSHNLVFLGGDGLLSHHALTLPFVHAQNMVAIFLIGNPRASQRLAIQGQSVSGLRARLLVIRFHQTRLG